MYVVSALLLWKCFNTAMLWYMVSKLCKPIGIVTSVGVVPNSTQIPDKDFLKWVPASGGEVPANAVVCGYDDDCEEPLFTGRANHQGAVIPGKIVCSHGVCYVAWDGKEHGKDDYEVLTITKLQWVSVENGQIPRDAVLGGVTVNGKNLFICQAHHKDSLIIGKIEAGRDVCCIPYDGEEVPKLNYQVLVQRP